MRTKARTAEKKKRAELPVIDLYIINTVSDLHV